MNFSIYLNDELAQHLQRIVEQEDVSRNQIISEAVRRLVEERESNDWGDEVLRWQGYPGFELPTNSDLIPPSENLV